MEGYLRWLTELESPASVDRTEPGLAVTTIPDDAGLLVPLLQRFAARFGDPVHVNERRVAVVVTAALPEALAVYRAEADAADPLARALREHIATARSTAEVALLQTLPLLVHGPAAVNEAVSSANTCIKEVAWSNEARCVPIHHAA